MRFVLAVSALVLLAQRPAAAAGLTLPGQLAELQIHGFISQGFLLTSANDYLAHSSEGSFEFTEIGLNFTLPATDRLTLGLQIFSHDLGPIGDYRATLDWYSLDYHWRDWLGIRAGRVKLPFGLYNDSSDIDAARTSVLLPQSIYPAQNRDFLLAQTGGEVYGYRDLGAAGGLDYRLYGGTIFLDVKQQPGSPFTVVDLNVPFVAGGRMLWVPPIEGLRLGGSLQFLRLETHLLPASSSSSVAVNVPVMLWVASVEYTVRDLLFAAEYSRWRVRAQSSNPAMFPESLTFSERGYALTSYRVNSWLQAGAYYSVLFPNTNQRGGFAGRQLDAALTLRFDVNAYWLVKVEGHYMHGTAGLSPSLNGNRPLSSLTPDWALFTVKTTAFF
ncbi:MAG: hypothetical protein AUH38_03615 [Deltaproteobacteria bacterium 13_1_40CM_68_24]|nr:MAG: hypothetical protein AUH38_03615 [Deltaproteobacteria bacterium 13_1_40CM_68_24]OLC72433.1 MAG: hypothetical protein AUH83_13725 [Deltaproteobacteria bacterium 13_1_40CM_4_68_19]